MKYQVLAGMKYNRWEVLKEVAAKRNGRNFLCRCVCGVEKVVRVYELVSGTIQSCGCLHKETVRIRPFEAIYNRLKRNAKRDNHKITLTYKEFLAFTEVKTCHYCGVLLDWHKYGGSAKYNLDRKNNDKGYTKANCVACCNLCNWTKGSRFTYEEFMLLCPIIRRILEDRTEEKAI